METCFAALCTAMAKTGSASNPPEESVIPIKSSMKRVRLPKFLASCDMSTRVFNRKFTTMGAEMMIKSLVTRAQSSAPSQERIFTETTETEKR